MRFCKVCKKNQTTLSRCLDCKKLQNPHPRRKKIKEITSGIDFLREKVRVRDNHTCQQCGKIWIYGQRRFDVHHTDPNEEGKPAFQYKLNKDMTKMITLCHKCHLNLPHIRKKVINRRIK